MESTLSQKKVTRRGFIKTSAALGAVAALGDHLFGPVKTLMAEAAPQSVTEGKWVPFYCAQCAMQIDPARAKVVNGVIQKIEGNPDPRFRDLIKCPSLVCVKARGLQQKTYNPYRIKAPMKRTNPKKGKDEDPRFVEISWDEALDIFTNKLKELKANGGDVNQEGVPKVALNSGRDGGYQGYGWSPFWSTWGRTDSLGGGGGVKCSHTEHIYGELWARAFVHTPDHRLNNLVIAFGKNAMASTTRLASTWKLFADAKLRGAKWIHLSPHLNVTGAKADEWIPIKSKTDDSVLFAMMNVVLHEMDWRKVCDIDFLKKVTASPYLVGPRGYFVRDPATKKPLVWDAGDGKAKVFDDPTIKDLALEGVYSVDGVENGPDGESYPATQGTTSFQLMIESVKDYTPEWASGISDVPAETIRRIAREFVDQAKVGATINVEGKTLPYRPVSILVGKSVNNGWGGYQCVWASYALLMLVGAVEVPGGTLGCYDSFYKAARFAADADGLLAYTPIATDKKNWEWPPRGREGMRTLTPFSGNRMGASGLSWLSIVQPLENWPSSTPDVCVSWRSNPVAGFYESGLIRKAMEKIPFTVGFAYTINETNWYADLLLPESGDIESLQLMSYPRSDKVKGIGAIEGYRGFLLRQPVVNPVFNTRDITDIYTDMAARMGPDFLATYNQKLMGADADPARKYTAGEVLDQQCRSATNGRYGLDWFKATGGTIEAVPYFGAYQYADMVERKIRYRLPYQEETRRKGEELGRRLHEVGIHWWDRQVEEYVNALPRWSDWRAVYEEVFQAGPEYDMWLISHRAHQFAFNQNTFVPWMIETGKDTLDVPGTLINPETAGKKGIKNGDRICLESRFGKTYSDAIVSETVRPDTLVVAEHFGTDRTPVTKDLGWPNMNETEGLDVRLMDECGALSEHTIVKIYKV